MNKVNKIYMELWKVIFIIMVDAVTV